MKKIIFPLIAVLVIAVVLLAFFLADLTSKLNAADSQIATMNTTVSSLQTNVLSLQTQLTASQTKVDSLQLSINATNIALQKAQADLNSQQDTNAVLAAQLKIVQYPRHFKDLAELTDWLQKDDTNAKYASVTDLQRALILEVRATQAGYILPSRIPLAGTGEQTVNVAIISGQVYTVRSKDDVVEPQFAITPQPSYPLPPP